MPRVRLYPRVSRGFSRGYGYGYGYFNPLKTCTRDHGSWVLFVFGLCLERESSTATIAFGWTQPPTSFNHTPPPAPTSPKPERHNSANEARDENTNEGGATAQAGAQTATRTRARTPQMREGISKGATVRTRPETRMQARVGPRHKRGHRRRHERGRGRRKRGANP